MNPLRNLLTWLFSCPHRNLGVWFRRGEKDWRSCLDCGKAVLSKVQAGPDEFIKPLIRLQEAKPAQPEGPTGLERRWLKDMGVQG